MGECGKARADHRAPFMGVQTCSKQFQEADAENRIEQAEKAPLSFRGLRRFFIRHKIFSVAIYFQHIANFSQPRPPTDGHGFFYVISWRPASAFPDAVPRLPVSISQTTP